MLRSWQIGVPLAELPLALSAPSTHRVLVENMIWCKHVASFWKKKGSNLPEILTHKKTAAPFHQLKNHQFVCHNVCVCVGGGLQETSLINMVLRWFFEKYQQIYNMSEFSLLERGHGPSFFFNLNPLNPILMLGVKCSWNRFWRKSRKCKKFMDGCQTEHK